VLRSIADAETLNVKAARAGAVASDRFLLNRSNGYLARWRAHQLRHPIDPTKPGEFDVRTRHGMVRSTYALILSALCLAPFCNTSCDDGGDSLRHERALREAAEAAKAAGEAALSSAQEAVSHWQVVAMLAVIAAVVLLIVGTGLGSKARRDAEASRQEASDATPRES